jgi:tetratricopeptide (TPR) repeat protein
MLVGGQEATNSNTPDGNKLSRVSRLKRRITRQSPRVKALIGMGILLLVGGGVLAAVNLYGGKTKEPTQPDNPTVAAFREKLPELAAQVDKDPKDINARQQYAVALYATSSLDKAKDQYEAAVKLNSKDAALHNNLANVLRDLKQYDAAIKEYDQAISLNAQYSNAYINKANLQVYTLKKPNDGIATYQKALEAMPDDQNIQILLALAYENTGDTGKAKQTLSDLVAKHSDNQAAKANLDRLNK